MMTIMAYVERIIGTFGGIIGRNAKNYRIGKKISILGSGLLCVQRLTQQLFVIKRETGSLYLMTCAG